MVTWNSVTFACRYCCNASTLQSRLVSYTYRFALSILWFKALWTSTWHCYTFLIAVIAAGVGSAAAVLLLAVVIVITFTSIALLKPKNTGKLVMGLSVCSLQQVFLSCSEHWGSTLLDSKQWPTVLLYSKQGRTILLKHPRIWCNWDEEKWRIWNSITASNSCWGKSCI